MSQIFHPATNTIAKVSIFGAVFILAGLGWGLFEFYRSPYMTQVGVAQVQPVPFSHKHHVADVGLDCRYCHTSVDKSSFAGIPPVATCMNCHAQLWNKSPMLAPIREAFNTGQPIEWVRVHNLPDFVYFHHAIHVQKGIPCAACHGPVDKMPLMWRESTLHMSWCLSCHLHPEKNVRPKEDVYKMNWRAPENLPALQAELIEKYKIQKLTDCTTCHR